MRNFDSIRSHLQAAKFRLTDHDVDVVCIELSLEHGTRHQAIFLSELDDDDGRPYLRVSTAVAPITGLDAKRALILTGRAAWATWPSATSTACRIFNCARTAPTTAWTQRKSTGSCWKSAVWAIAWSA